MFTVDEVKEILKKAHDESLIEESSAPISKEMDKALNRGVRIMFNSAMIELCQREFDRLTKLDEKEG